MSELYAKVTLTNNKTIGDGSFFSVDVFLPEGASPDPSEQIYYQASRFEHGSMIGNFAYRPGTAPGQSNGNNGNSESDDRDSFVSSQSQMHHLFGTDLWRIPHNSFWPESGLGLASEFGVGDDGDFCFYRCGWLEQEAITNGVLGYRQAQPGQPFLKIGVGSLIKGSCPSCDSTEDYKFNSPYQFAERPLWTATRPDDYNLRLFHQASLYGNQFGYSLEKNIQLLESNELIVTTTLVNTGRDAFATVWYSHNFFHCDSVAVGPGYALELDLNADHNPLYDEPGTWSWSTPLAQYATVMATLQRTVRVVMNQALSPGVRIKTEFQRDDNSHGSFVLQACGANIQTTLESNDGLPLQMYAYNLYLERGTFSPEPQILLQLPPNGGSRSWKQKLTITNLQHDHQTTIMPWTHLFSLWAASLTKQAPLPLSSSTQEGTPTAATSSPLTMVVGGFFATFFLLLLALRYKMREHKRHLYTRISDQDEDDDIWQNYQQQQQQQHNQDHLNVDIIA